MSGDSALMHYFADIEVCEALDRRMEISIVKEIRRLEAERWLTLFTDMVNHRLIDAAVKTACHTHLKEACDVNRIKDALNRLRKAEQTLDTTENTEPFRQALTWMLHTITEVDSTRTLYAHIMAELTATRHLDSVLHDDTIWELEKSDACIEGTIHRLINANLRHVVAIAQRYDFGLLPLGDLIQEGNIGLIEAVRTFDHTRGVRLRTFASKFIIHSMRKALAHKGRTIRIPANVIDAHFRIRQSSELFRTKFGRQPNQRELARAMEISVAELNRLLDHPPLNAVSLSASMSSSDGEAFIDTLIDEHHRNQDESLLLKRWHKEMSRVLSVLTKLERRIIVWRFGLDGNDALSFRQIGKRCNLSGERIRQVQNMALGKMRLAFCPEMGTL